ncbi:MAG: hypothetical protein R3194_04870 [Limnobacter sp.]|nr:hypothetical protein [Limnobacter sp.]
MSECSKLAGLALCAVMCIALVACGGAEVELTVRSLNSRPQAAQADFTTLALVQTSAPGTVISPSRNWVIRDASTWAATWIELHQSQPANHAPANMPNVNFNQSQIIGVSRFASNSCTKPFVSAIINRGDRLEVQIGTGKPQPGQFCKQEASVALHFVTIAAHSLPVEFTDLP